jgi:hypothetical protein
MIVGVRFRAPLEGSILQIALVLASFSMGSSYWCKFNEVDSGRKVYRLKCVLPPPQD